MAKSVSKFNMRLAKEVHAKLIDSDQNVAIWRTRKFPDPFHPKRMIYFSSMTSYIEFLVSHTNKFTPDAWDNFVKVLTK